MNGGNLTLHVAPTHFEHNTFWHAFGAVAKMVFHGEIDSFLDIEVQKNCGAFNKNWIGSEEIWWIKDPIFAQRISIPSICQIVHQIWTWLVFNHTVIGIKLITTYLNHWCSIRIFFTWFILTKWKQNLISKCASNKCANITVSISFAKHCRNSMSKSKCKDCT